MIPSRVHHDALVCLGDGKPLLLTAVSPLLV
jgi:hypothetical protein